MRTRFAPTPSGYLHLGNAAHLVLVSNVARQQGAQIHLRIDDIDQYRCSREYVEDIFDLLDWLDLPWDSGPTSTADMGDWAQHSRLPRYRHALAMLIESGCAYGCRCSRSQWTGYEGDDCPGGCRQLGLSFRPGEMSWRIHIPRITDPVIWRRDDLPAYHLTSVVDDDDYAIDLIIRGADLMESTSIQRRISALLPESEFQTSEVLHHALVMDATGKKMSKSGGPAGERLPRTEETRRRIHELAEELRQSLIPDRPRSLGN